MDLRAQLQTAIGSAYSLERELGGGGMSRVFAAEEVALGRKVVIKVLPPELVAGVNLERFRREIQLAARLQQAHIVPVLSTGEMSGVPYYTMPFVEGESLRARLARTGALPIAEAVSVLRDVAKALAYAHEHGVVHRDIKPDNVLLAGGSAVVTDFGIAKALSASRTEGHTPTLTQIGTSLGTPAYMAPEQAAADPATDHRADIYSFGAMAYELLAGRPPFVASAPQKLLAMQMGEAPRPVTELRPDVPRPLAALVMSCLEKDAARRPQSAADLLRVLDSVTSPGTNPAMPAILIGGRGTLRGALALYIVALLLVAFVAKAATVVIGLPDWVFPGALTVMALGAPVIAFTAYAHRVARRVATATPTYTPGGTPSFAARGTMATLAVRASPHLSWRRAAYGGVAAVALFALAVGLYMLLRALGIGPAGSLFAAGTLQPNERLLVADFAGPSSDTSLGTVVTEAFRTSLAQSQSINVMQAAAVRDVLRRMQRPTITRVDLPLAREIGTREGLKAIVDGDIIALGGRYQIAVRLVSTQTGEPLASFATMAGAEAEILPAIDRLTKEMRAKIGESLRSVQAAKPLEQVTTPSLEALRKYVQAVHAMEVEGDIPKGTTLLDEAIALDSNFAMAYRKYAMEVSNTPGQASRAMSLLEKAYQHRDRLSDAERYLTVAAYFDRGPHADVAKATEAYEALLDLQPDNGTALNNVGLNYMFERDFTKAEGVFRRAVALPSPAAQEFTNLVAVEFRLGKRSEAEQTLAAAAQRFPNNPAVALQRATFAAVTGNEDSAIAVIRDVLRRRAGDLPVRASASFFLANLARVHGRLAEAAKWQAEGSMAQQARGARQAVLNASLDSAFYEIWFRGDSARALRLADAALAAHPLESLSIADRNYPRLVAIYSLAGRPERAKTFAAAFDRTRDTVTTFGDETTRQTMRGQIAVAERRYADAIKYFRLADVGGCTICALPNLAHAYDLADHSDSAIAIFTRYLQTPILGRLNQGALDPQYLAGVYKRLGELYEARGDLANAQQYYGKFVALWKDADPELQPKVVEVRKRLERLRASAKS